MRVILGTLILANLTKRDFDRLRQAKILYTGSAGDPHFDKDPSPWGKNAPYMATYREELARAIVALGWTKFRVEVSGTQWLVKKFGRRRP